MTVQAVSDKLSRSQAVVLLRYTLIISVAYLLLVKHEFSSAPSGLILLIAVALMSNVVMAQLPARITDSTTFSGGVILGDTLWITAALLYSGLFGAEFFSLYFFVLLLAAIGENLGLIVVGTIAVCTAYIFVLSATGGSASFWNSGLLIRIPFLLTAAAFYGYLVDRVRWERQRAREGADTVAHLEEIQRELAQHALQLERANQDLAREISERERAEQAVKAAKDYAENLINSSLDMIVSTDVHRNIVEFNQAAENAFGYSKAEVVGEPIDILYAEPSEGFRVQTNLVNHGMFAGEIRNKRKSGESFYSYLSASVFRDPHGRVVGGVGVSRDITERKRVEEELRETRHYLTRLVEASGDAIISTNKEGNVVLFNTGAEALLGYRREEVLGQCVTVVYESEERAKHVMRQMRQQGGTVAGLETILRAKDGSLIPVLISASILFDAENQEAGTVGFNKDLRERKQAEEALQRLSHQNELILTSAGEGIYGLDLEGKTTFINPAGARMIGWEVEDLIGKPQHAILHHSKPDGTPYPREECPIYAAFRDGAVHHVADEVFWRKDGTSFPVEYTSTPIRDENAEWVGAVVTFRDITERKRAERELQATQIQLMESAKLESVGRLAAGVAHEVKNPLAIIQQGLVYISHGLSTTENDKVALALEKMDNAVRRADRVIGGLLDFSAPSAVDVTPTELNTVVEQSLLLLTHELVKAHVTVIKELGGNLPSLELDRRKIEHVFVNIFTNAIQAMPEGGTLTIKMYAEQFTEPGRWKPDQYRIGDPLVVVEVEDTGRGIPGNKLDRVFDPFFTTKASGQGTGLGLTVTRKIIEMHGGMIEIRNRQEGGVRVILTFKTEGGHSHAEEDVSARREGGTRHA